MYVRCKHMLILILICFPLYAKKVAVGESIWAMQQHLRQASPDDTIAANEIPYTISQSGVYCLAESITFTTDTIITVSWTENVVINLNGHELRGTNDQALANNHLVFVTTSTAVIIKKGFMRGGAHSIYSEDSNRIKIERLKIRDSVFDGIYINNSSGINVRDIEITNVGRNGIYFLGNSSKCIIRDCMINYPGSRGIKLDTGIQRCAVLKCGIFACACNSGFYDLGSENIFLSCLVQGFGVGNAFELGTHGIARKCLATNADSGFVLSGDNAVMRECIIMKNNTGIKITGSNCAAVANSIRGKDAVTSVGVDDQGSNSYVFNNLVYDCGTTFSGTQPKFLVSASATSTAPGYWANLVP